MSRNNLRKTALLDKKNHYKMYKSKRGWIVSGLTTATMMGMFFATTYTVNADSVQPAEIPSISNITEKKGSTENNDGYSVSVDHSALDEAVNNAKNAGVDMTTPEPIEQACQVFEQKLDDFEKLMKA